MSSIDKRGKAFRARVRRKGFKAKSRTLPTKKAAEAWAHVTETLLTNGVDAVPDRRAEYTLAEALERYKAEVSSAKKGARQEGLRIATWQRHRLAALKLSALAPAHFNEYIREREADGASGSTILNELSLISSAFKKAQKSWGMPYLQNPIQYVDKPRPNAPRDWDSPDFPDTKVKCDDDLGGTGWEGDSLQRSSSTKRSSWCWNGG